MVKASLDECYHMTGNAKPWYQKRAHLEDPDCTNKIKRECDIQVKWYQLLKEALVSIEMIDHISWDFLGLRGSAPVGVAPNPRQVAQYMYFKMERNWNQYVAK